jgi:hypothetical protein
MLRYINILVSFTKLLIIFNIYKKSKYITYEIVAIKFKHILHLPVYLKVTNYIDRIFQTNC